MNILNKKYMDVRINKRNVCTYKGECLIDNVLFNKYELCEVCKYKTPLDIPAILNEEAIKRGKQRI